MARIDCDGRPRPRTQWKARPPVPSWSWALAPLLAPLAAVVPLLIPVAAAQHCADTCPPLNDLGRPIASLCVGVATPEIAAAKSHAPCAGTLPDAAPGAAFSLDDFRGPGRVTVVSNYYFGCNAGRREAGVYAHVAQRLFDAHPTRVMFVASNKGASCDRWSAAMRSDAKSYFPDHPKPDSMPVVVDDLDFEIRDLYFTPPFGHPSYVVLDGELKVRHKFIGPCCGKSSFWDCSLDEAKALNGQLASMVEHLLEEQSSGGVPTPAPTGEQADPTGQPTEPDGGCTVGDWSDWSACSVTCGDNGLQFRWRVVADHRTHLDAENDDNQPLPPCPTSVETKPCGPANPACGTDCTPEVGEAYTVDTVVEGLSGPRDVAFHPTPGLHLTTYAEGRHFPPGNLGHGEAWVLNGGNHSISIVAAVGTANQTTLSRRDRGYYHYMIDATAFSFNSVADSGRDPDRDGFNYWAVCNDNLNTYLDTKEPNYFMGPTLYDSKPGNRNTVNHLGEDCAEYEQCYFMHADMLHESPACIGLVHDPEARTAHGHVYWAFDATGDGTRGQLVRFDFQQPHGPGSMDHSIAAVRRYPGVALTRGPGKGGHAGMAVHSVRREVYIANPGEGTVIVVGADTGSYARIAREEYPIYSNQLPSFDYSIWECAEQRTFVSGIDTPSGLTLSIDEERLYVAERSTGNILVYEVSSATLLDVIETEYMSIGGMTVSPNTNTLFFVDEDTNTLNSIQKTAECTDEYTTRTSEDFEAAVQSTSATFSQLTPPQSFRLYHDVNCVVETLVPNVTYFEQVHNDTGYAGNHTESTQELAERTDCEYDSDLNFDALLLGGYYCHVCLPQNEGAGCDKGGICQNVQWKGYACDNHYRVEANDELTVRTSLGEQVATSIVIDPNVVYRFTISGKHTVYLSEHESGTTRLEYPQGCIGAVREVTNGEMTFDPSLFPEGSRPYTIYLRRTNSNESANRSKFAKNGKTKVKLSKTKKIIINYPCKDYELKRKGDPTRDCTWLSALKSRKKKRICADVGVSKKCPETCGLCKKNSSSDSVKLEQPLHPPAPAVTNTTTRNGNEYNHQKRQRRRRHSPRLTNPVAAR